MHRAIQATAAALALWAGAGIAHEQWIVAETANGRSTVRICSGHGFPAGDVLIAERLLAETVVVDPAGTVAAFAPRALDKAWTAEVAFDKPGVWTVAFALQKPQEPEPFFRGRCLTVVGGADAPARYASGKGLELVPLAPLSTLRPGASLPVAIHFDGAPAEGKISVTSEKGAVSFLSTGKQRPAEIKLPTAGAYLLTVVRGGKTFALTIAVAAAAEDAP